MVRVVIVFGLPGSGKSYFAKHLAEMMKAEYVSSDIVRKDALKKNDYSLEGKEKVYAVMLKRSIAALQNDEEVVLDGTFYRKSIRTEFQETLEKYARLFFIEVIADEQLIKVRTQKKRKYSDADFNIYQKVKKEFQPMNSTHLILKSSNNNLSTMLKEASEYIN